MSEKETACLRDITETDIMEYLRRENHPNLFLHSNGLLYANGTEKAIAALTAFTKKFWIKPSGMIQKSCGNNTQPN